MSKSFDVIIVGCGVIGASVAYHLSKEFKGKIALLDIRKPGVASWASAGGLWPLGESVGLGCGIIFFQTLRREQTAKSTEKNHTPEQYVPHMLPNYLFEFSFASNDMFPRLHQELKKISGVDFYLQSTGLLFTFLDEYDVKFAEILQAQLPQIYTQYLTELTAEKIKQTEPFISKNVLGGLHFNTDHQVNPFLLAKAFRDSAQINGVTIYEDTEVIDVDITNGKVTGIATARGEKIKCHTLVNAAGAWAKEIGDLVGINLPVVPVKGQIVLSEKLPTVLNSCISTSDCYIAQKNNGELLIGSTTEEAVSSMDYSFDKLKALSLGALRAIPNLKNLNIKRTWAGLRPGSPDEAPILGPVNSVGGYINACGHFRTGILTSPITGEIIKNIILGNKDQPVDITPFLYDRFVDVDLDSVQPSYQVPHEKT